jgi:hypothetical protein
VLESTLDQSVATPVAAPVRSSSPSGSGAARTTQMKVAASQAGDFDAQERALAPVQRHGGGNGGTESVHAAAAHGISGSGGAMPHGDAIQRSFGGYDLSNVQAHTDSAAAEGSQAMGADAYATGNHVAFNGAPDLHTAAHEAAHVVQQQAGVQLSGGVGAVGDPYENHADRVADAVVQGKSAEPILAEMAGGSSHGGVQQSVQMAAGDRFTRGRGRARRNDRSEGVDEQVGDLRSGTGAAPKEADVNQVIGGLIEPKDHPYYPTFKNRILGLFARVGSPPGADPEALALDIWTQIVEATLNQTNHTMNAEGTGASAGYLTPRNRVDMESPAYQNAVKEFQTVVGVLSAAAKSQFVKANSFGFWSAHPAKTLAEQTCDLTLETSGIGAVLDGLPNISHESNAWAPLWGALSKAYGEAIGEQMLTRDVKVHVFKGKGAESSGNVFAAVEKKALEKGVERAGRVLEDVVLYHAAVGKVDNVREPDLTKEGGMFKGTLKTSSDEETVIKAQNDYWAEVEATTPPAAQATRPSGA